VDNEGLASLIMHWGAIVIGAVGVAFCLLSAVGVVRLNDLYNRMQAASKGSTLGAMFLLVAAAMWFGEGAIWLRVLAVVVFLMLTAPVAAHLIARAGYLSGEPMQKDAVMDEWDKQAK